MSLDFWGDWRTTQFTCCDFVARSLIGVSLYNCTDFLKFVKLSNAISPVTFH
jgi:hypothetical protein